MKQTFKELKSQPLIAAVTIIGTSLALFLIMIVVMLNQVKVAPFAPESNRDRFLHWKFMSLKYSDGENNAAMSYRTFKEMFDSLKSAEAVTAYAVILSRHMLTIPGSKPSNVEVLETDDVFFKVFDFTFLKGAPYSKADFESGLSKIVIDENIAKDVFNRTDVVGEQLLLDMEPYIVVGVVKPVSRLANTAYGQAWVPFTSTQTINNVWSDGYLGLIGATVLAPSSDLDAVREEINHRFAVLNSKVREVGKYEFIQRNRPYDQEESVASPWANEEGDVWALRKSQYMVYLILLLVPAINLSSMTHSRLRKRAADIAVRRAFGATSNKILLNLINESFIITLVGGIIGLIMSVVFAWSSASYLFGYDNLTVNSGIFLQWRTFAWALGFCFLLNLLCSGYPAWKSSRTSIVNSLSENNR